MLNESSNYTTRVESICSPSCGPGEKNITTISCNPKTHSAFGCQRQTVSEKCNNGECPSKFSNNLTFGAIFAILSSIIHKIPSIDLYRIHYMVRMEPLDFMQV